MKYGVNCAAGDFDSLQLIHVFLIYDINSIHEKVKVIQHMNLKPSNGSSIND